MCIDHIYREVSSGNFCGLLKCMNTSVNTHGVYISIDVLFVNDIIHFISISAVIWIIFVNLISMIGIIDIIINVGNIKVFDVSINADLEGLAFIYHPCVAGLGSGL